MIKLNKYIAIYQVFVDQEINKPNKKVQFFIKSIEFTIYNISYRYLFQYYIYLLKNIIFIIINYISTSIFVILI